MSIFRSIFHSFAVALFVMACASSGSASAGNSEKPADARVAALAIDKSAPPATEEEYELQRSSTYIGWIATLGFLLTFAGALALSWKAKIPVRWPLSMALVGLMLLAFALFSVTIGRSDTGGSSPIFAQQGVRE
ncbi:MAG: hypothetical protein K5821_15950 [Nitrobacter sp.]|uniref:hypothetical protein n=1 Tax=Nitrobacter sp. TaxID=29420 RepID=UPI0026173ACA|nr:hypothetical protein [Nitrobacter sp.]MCV0387862.1 hypothetical protein [Nitrobacter sp.]